MTSKSKTEQQEELIQTLKFTPRTYTVRIHGYGGEMVMGRLDPEIVEYFKENKISLSEYATTWGEPGDDDYIDVPEDMQPFSQGNWYDCDNIEHCAGAEFGGSWITVDDENGDEVWQREVNSTLEDEGCEIDCFCEETIEEHCDAKNAVFVGQGFEKGQFFEANLDLTAPFDPTEFKFTYSELAGWPILNVVEYNGEELEGSDGYSTTGKSSSFVFYVRNEDDNIDEYEEPEED